MDISEECHYPAIEKALIVLRQRLGASRRDSLTAVDLMPQEHYLIGQYKLVEHETESVIMSPANWNFPVTYSNDGESSRAINKSDRKLSAVHWKYIREKCILCENGNKVEQELMANKLMRKGLMKTRIISMVHLFTKNLLRVFFRRLVYKAIRKSCIRERLKLRLDNIWDKDKFSLKFPPNIRKHCVARLGKRQLAIIYSNWCVKRKIFSDWLLLFH